MRSAWTRYLELLDAFRRERGLLLLQIAPLLVSIGTIGIAYYPTDWPLVIPMSAAGVLALSGLLLPRLPRLARATALVAITTIVLTLVPAMLERPALVVLGVLGLWILLHLVLTEPSLVTAESQPRPEPRRTARLTSLIALGAWFVEVLAAEEVGFVGATTTLATIVIAAIVSLRWALAEAERRWMRWALAGISVAAVAGAVILRSEPPLALSCLAAVPLAIVALAGGSDEPGALARLVEHPARLLVATFFALGAIGTAALALPVASADQPIHVLDAAFTSVSAVCVTGLIVLDTPVAFSTFGHVAILLLIQVGGLGIMTFYTVALAAVGRRLSLRHERAVAGALNIEDRRHLVGSLRRVLIVTFASEAIGAVLLFGGFLLEGASAGTAAWHAVFTSVSAFCNAGFALQSDSLISYQTNPLVLYTVAGLIVAGGLSPAGVVAVPHFLRGRRLGLQQGLALVTTAALLVAGTLLYALFEWTESLGALSWGDRVHNAIFQSVTLRTAGFNSVDLAVTRPETQTMMIAFMLIGGSSGGTAGGLKTTTVAVIVLMVVATLRGQRNAVAFGRRIGTATVFKTGAVATLGVATFLLGLFALQLTQDIDLDLASFEVASALGTVGLSIGATAMLDPVGKIIIMICMFAGRVGPLTLFLILTERQRETGIGYPTEEVEVG